VTKNILTNVSSPDMFTALGCVTLQVVAALHNLTEVELWLLGLNHNKYQRFYFSANTVAAIFRAFGSNNI
jgi:hypothetical protein